MIIYASIVFYWDTKGVSGH